MFVVEELELKAIYPSNHQSSTPGDFKSGSNNDEVAPLVACDQLIFINSIGTNSSELGTTTTIDNCNNDDDDNDDEKKSITTVQHI